jgi:NarL family two-component system response regulator LiaR
MSSPIRILIVDDHAIVRKGIRALFRNLPEIEVVGEAENGREAIAAVERLQPDVVLMDLLMPEMDGIEATGRVMDQHPDVRILVLTSFAGEDKVFPAIKAGALGYHLKDSSPEELVQAIHQVHRGESSLHPVIARKVLQELSRPSERPPTPDPRDCGPARDLRDDGSHPREQHPQQVAPGQPHPGCPLCPPGRFGVVGGCARNLDVYCICSSR